jgi:NADPH:quinone reductase-like Zn-dependent oxidoreductase
VAKHLGARVIATTSTANVIYVRSLGADQVIDYIKEDFTEVAPDVDAVFDTVGGEVATKSFEVIKPDGRAAFIGSGAKAPESPRRDVSSLRPAVGRDRQHLQRIGELVALGAVRVPETTVFPLAEAAAAHRISQSRHFRGKLLLRVG